ncbi:MAG: SUMF1/EgtB/PvdO family nonheme iron enzyme, partial [Saprospiraceae bacterium]|nr:SUMF1/EgtB/PvdO family nonheme iron enzyme [Saprospiraceae bacterium]
RAVDSAILCMIILLLAGCEDHTNDVAGLHLQADPFEVTIDSFRHFVESTGYATTADSLEWSGVFDTTQQRWIVQPGANWERPLGHKIADGAFPVTQVSYYDACAYCAWKGGRLPTAAEWDLLAGDLVLPGNVWEGPFPMIDLGKDGFAKRIAPVGRFAPNAYGLHDMFGNVWEWTSTMKDDSVMIIKGGSFLCDETYCSGYYPSRYQTTPKDSGLNHLGFRCVYPSE